MINELNKLMEQHHKVTRDYCKVIDKPVDKIKQVLVRMQEDRRNEAEKESRNPERKVILLKEMMSNDDILNGVGR